MEDKLTQLSDRKTFFKILAKQIVLVHDYKVKLALLVIDINRFKRINKLYDYPTGDRVLQKLATILKSVKREQDYLARIGDNQFALILVNIMNTGHATLAAQKVLRLLETPFIIGETKLQIEATIGIALCPIHASRTTALLKESEEALLLARQYKKSIGIAASDIVDDELSETWDIEMDIEEAIQTQQFSIYYQPKISLSTGKPVGAEALLRWKHRVRGFISPAVFIPIVEKTGYIKPITSWLLNSVLRHSSRWTTKWGALSVSANIPPELIVQLDLKDFVNNAIELWGSDNITLILEIIERSLVEDTENCFDILKELQSMGVQISIDDFGTGYSSLSYFKLLPINELKIDQSFVFELLTDKANEKLVHLMIELAHNFALKVVAEGIEDQETYIALKNMGCDVGQGYYMAKPMPEEEFAKWLETFNEVYE
ncbi:MAG: bifunctional diguanylate cyclase/phosphodiesterase [Gammaproteobacteria bacterium]|nr:bifunctional diguanylate cyclase/phosphodiesterase [Gammaproteobacteria bacterium]